MVSITQKQADQVVEVLRETQSRVAAQQATGLAASVVGKICSATGLGKSPSKAEVAERDRRIVTEVWGVKLPRRRTVKK